jgi:hypothetical protein
LSALFPEKGHFGPRFSLENAMMVSDFAAVFSAGYGHFGPRFSGTIWLPNFRFLPIYLTERIVNVITNGDGMSDLLSEFFTEEELQEELGKKKMPSSKRKLRKQRAQRTGPPFFKDGQMILYPRAGYVDWINSRVVKPRRQSV